MFICDTVDQQSLLIQACGMICQVPQRFECFSMEFCACAKKKHICLIELIIDFLHLWFACDAWHAIQIYFDWLIVSRCLLPSLRRFVGRPIWLISHCLQLTLVYYQALCFIMLYVTCLRCSFLIFFTIVRHFINIVRLYCKCCHPFL